ncbi:MAG TPA: hypothetical protein VGN20_21135 [Mucilaginibacter sp.]|jgi:hypothetical protein
MENNGLTIQSVDETGLIYISQGDLTLKISLDNVRKNYERDNDEAHISELVQTIISYSTELPENWVDVKDNIYISLFPNNVDFDNFIHKEISDEFGKVYVHRGGEKSTWITKDDLARWGITETDLAGQADKNANKLLNQTLILFDIIENRKLGRIDIEHETLKGALLFAPAIKEKIETDFGFPFYAVIPVRDFCYVFSEQDFEFFSSRIGEVVVGEYKNSGYPITTEILKFTDKGVEVVGKYPVAR